MKVVPYRRKREGKTNYRKRLKLLKSKKPRLVIRKTNKYIIAQIIDYSPNGDIVLNQAVSKELKKYGWNMSFKNIPAAYLTGYLLGRKFKKDSELVLDIGLQEKGGRIFAALKGAVDAGLKVKFNESILPDEKRIVGEHIDEYLKSSSDKIQFSRYKKLNLNVSEEFKKVKEKISKV